MFGNLLSVWQDADLEQSALALPFYKPFTFVDEIDRIADILVRVNGARRKDSSSMLDTLGVEFSGLGNAGENSRGTPYVEQNIKRGDDVHPSKQNGSLSEGYGPMGASSLVDEGSQLFFA